MLSYAMAFYHRVYGLGELQFITASTYRCKPLFLSDRFRRCFVQRLEEVRQEWDSKHNNPVTRGLPSKVARTCGLGPRLFIRNRAFHLQIRVRPSMARSARSLPSQIGRTETAGADVTPR